MSQPMLKFSYRLAPHLQTRPSPTIRRSYTVDPPTRGTMSSWLQNNRGLASVSGAALGLAALYYVFVNQETASDSKGSGRVSNSSQIPLSQRSASPEEIDLAKRASAEAEARIAAKQGKGK